MSSQDFHTYLQVNKKGWDVVGDIPRFGPQIPSSDPFPKMLGQSPRCGNTNCGHRTAPGHRKRCRLMVSPAGQRGRWQRGGSAAGVLIFWSLKVSRSHDAVTAADRYHASRRSLYEYYSAECVVYCWLLCDMANPFQRPRCHARGAVRSG